MKDFLKSKIENRTEGKISLVLSLDGVHRVDIPAGEERIVNSYWYEPFAGYEVVGYFADGHVETIERPDFELKYGEEDWLVKLKNSHDELWNFKIMTFYSGVLYLPRGIEFYAKISELDQFCEWESVEVLPDLIECSKRPKMHLILRAGWHGTLQKGDDGPLERKVPNIKFVKRSAEDLKRLAKARELLQGKIDMTKEMQEKAMIEIERRRASLRR